MVMNISLRAMRSCLFSAFCLLAMAQQIQASQVPVADQVAAVVADGSVTHMPLTHKMVRAIQKYHIGRGSKILAGIVVGVPLIACALQSHAWYMVVPLLQPTVQLLNDDTEENPLELIEPMVVVAPTPQEVPVFAPTEGLSFINPAVTTQTKPEEPGALRTVTAFSAGGASMTAFLWYVFGR